MKSIYKVLAVVAFTAPLLTSCIEEAIPTDVVTQTQLQGNPSATSSLVWGMPARLNQITVNSSWHFDWGYPSIMHIRDVMTEDMAVEYAGGFDWFGSWSQVDNIGQTSGNSQMIFNYFYEQILTTNKTISAISDDTDNSTLRSNLAQGYAYRAFIYLDAARMYEVLPSDFFPECKSVENNDIKGVSLPIVTELTTEKEARDNPRASHKDMYAFIMSDLDKAESLFSSNADPVTSKLLPDLAVVYGLKARAALWDASYQEEINGDIALAATQYTAAAKYARQAIAESGATPLTQDEWLNTTTGFNDETVSSWLMAGKYNAEDAVVEAGGIRTWASFCVNEENFGYAAPAQGAFTMIGASLYNRMSDRDFRKLSFFAPEGSSLRGREPFLDKEFAEENFYDYVAIKFRPGEGNMDDYLKGAVVAYPMMRVEEMYLIEAEATAHNNPAAGNDLLKDFVKTYRYSSYNNILSDKDAIIEEIIFQKRVELWGEGQAFFDVKRLGYSVIRSYDGTNFDNTLNTFNTNGRPCWMNMCIVQTEGNNNAGVKGFNTPDPDNLYTPIR